MDKVSLRTSLYNVGICFGLLLFLSVSQPIFAGRASFSKGDRVYEKKVDEVIHSIMKVSQKMPRRQEIAIEIPPRPLFTLKNAYHALRVFASWVSVGTVVEVVNILYTVLTLSTAGKKQYIEHLSNIYTDSLSSMSPFKLLGKTSTGRLLLFFFPTLSIQSKESLLAMNNLLFSILYADFTGAKASSLGILLQRTLGVPFAGLFAASIARGVFFSLIWYLYQYSFPAKDYEQSLADPYPIILWQRDKSRRLKRSKSSTQKKEGVKAKEDSPEGEALQAFFQSA